MSTPKITLSPALKRKLKVQAIFNEEPNCDGLDPYDLEQAGLTIWRVAVTDYKARLNTRLIELENEMEAHDQLSQLAAVAMIRKIIEEL